MFFKSSEWTPFDDATDRAVRELKHHEIGSPEYVKVLNAASQLQEMKLKEKRSPVSKDTMLIVGANLLGIILIINHEFLHPVTTRATGLLLKPRV